MQRTAPTAYVVIRRSEALPLTASIAWSAPHAEQTDRPSTAPSLSLRVARGRRCTASLITPAPRVNRSPGTKATYTPSPRRAPQRPRTTDVAPKKHCCEERDEDKCPQLHSCVSYEHFICNDRTGQANPSARQQQTKTPVVLSVVDLFCGLSRLSKRGESDRRGCICLTARERPPAAPS